MRRSRKAARRSATTRAALIVLAIAFVAAVTVWASLPRPAEQNARTNLRFNELVNTAKRTMRQGNFSLAAIQLKNALLLDPKNGEVRVLLGSAMLQTGDTVGAELELRQARSNGAKDIDVVPVLLEAMLANKEAGDLLRQFPDPGADKGKLAAFILKRRAMAYQVTGDPANAVASMDRSLAITRDATGLLIRAQIAILQSLPQVAIGYIDEAIRMAPDNVTAKIMKATALRYVDKKAALAILDDILKTHPDNIRAEQARIELLLDLNQIDEAQKSVDALLARSPDMPIANFYKAELLGIRKKPLEGWRIAQTLPPGYIQSDARFVLGAAQLASESGNLESAHAILTQFVMANPNALEPRLQLAELRNTMNNARGALDILAPVMSSQDPRTLRLIAATYAKLDQQQNATKYLRKAAAAGSRSGPALQQPSH